jgi:hypothetical protein
MGENGEQLVPDAPRPVQCCPGRGAFRDREEGTPWRHMPVRKRRNPGISTADSYCAKRDQKVHVDKGDKIPKCPNGHTEFEARRHEPDTKS